MKKFNPRMLEAIVNCFILLHVADQEWLLNRLSDEWMKNPDRKKRK